MFNTRDSLFSKKDEITAKDSKSAPLLRHGSTPGRPETAPPPESPVTASPPPTTTGTPPTAQSGSKLIVGPDIKLKGVEITDCDTLVVEGRVEASMDSRVIQIAEHGVYTGTVGIDLAEIRGRFGGELTARKQLIVHATGRVSGTIRYGKITVEDGGEITGNITTLSGAAALPQGAGTAVDIMTPYDPFARAGKSTGKPPTAPH